MQNFSRRIPTKSIFAAGRIRELEVCPLPGKKAVIAITSGKSMKASGYLEKVRDLLAKNNF